ncbi:hypothetical protein Tco_1287495, partial [Tanacetum coccineum]
YDGLPIQQVALPSPEHIPGPEEPQTPPVPQDEDGHEPMFIQAHDPDYVPEPIYPVYIPLEDDHEFLVEEQSLPPVDSPTVESSGYVAESDPKEDPEEYEDDEIEDGPVNYPMDGGEDGDDDDGDSSRDDADDEDEDEGDEDEEDEDEEEEHLALPTPLITVRHQASISLPPEAEVERLLAMPTPPPSPPILLSPPSTGECLARTTSIQALINAATAALPSPPLPPLPPSLYVPPLVDRRDDIPESELPPRKRSCLSTLGPKYEVGESSTAKPTREAVPEIAPMTMGEVNTRVTELAELHEPVDLPMEAVHYELQTHREQVHETRSQMQQAEMVELRETDCRRQVQMVETLHVMRDMRREMGDMQAELLALREQQRRAGQPGPDARVPDHQEASRDADSRI